MATRFLVNLKKRRILGHFLKIIILKKYFFKSKRNIQKKNKYVIKVILVKFKKITTIVFFN